MSFCYTSEKKAVPVAIAGVEFTGQYFSTPCQRLRASRPSSPPSLKRTVSRTAKIHRDVYTQHPANRDRDASSTKFAGLGSETKRESRLISYHLSVLTISQSRVCTPSQQSKPNCLTPWVSSHARTSLARQPLGDLARTPQVLQRSAPSPPSRR